MPRTRYIIQEGTLNEDRVEFGVATFSGGRCRRVFAADGRSRGRGTFTTLKTLLPALIEPKNQGASWPICLHGLSRA